MRPLVLMKNVLFCALPMGALLLCACDKGGTQTAFTPKLDEAFSVMAEMDYGEDSNAKLLLTRYGEEHWDAAFEEPASLAGVVLTIEDEAVSANYKGLSFTVPKSALPAKAMLLLLTDVLKELSDEESLPAVANEDNTGPSAATQMQEAIRSRSSLTAPLRHSLCPISRWKSPSVITRHRERLRRPTPHPKLLQVIPLPRPLPPQPQQPLHLHEADALP